MAPSLWSKDNKTYIIMHSTINMPAPRRKRPMVLLFDIGGVCVRKPFQPLYFNELGAEQDSQVVSPFQVILDYEKSKGIPQGFINWTISQAGREGAWARLERGELVCDQTFYSAWKADLTNEKRWREYYARHLAQQRKENKSHAPEEAAYNVPPVPDIDAEWLHNEMMSIARELDPYMGPALKKLRQYADKSDGKLILGALSNTCIFPPGHKLYDATTSDGKASQGLAGIFDIFISSAHIGMRKPDEEAYKYAIVRLHEFVKTKGYGDGVKPEDIIFLDDIGQNLKTAKNLGMQTIKVSLGHIDQAVKELEKVTGLDLTSDKARL